MSFDRRLVLDKDVLVSAAIRPESVPALAFEKAMLKFDPCASAETRAELECVLGRSKYDRYADSDPHLTSMHPWRGIAILPPTAFLIDID